MKHGISEFRGFAGIVAGLAMLAGSGVEASPVRLDHPGGVSALVYPAEELASRLTTFQGTPAIELPDGRVIPVITDINDPAIYNHGDGSFHSFTPSLVEPVLAEVSRAGLVLPVRIYLLPYPRQSTLASSTSGDEIFLSPHVLEIEPATAAYIVAHELGHAFHNRYLPAGSPRWDGYRALRGITDESVYNDTAAHAYRPREIFAEDFRVLFGGTDAYFGGHVENTVIAEPATVPGLREFYQAAATARAATVNIDATCSPNPFNPETEIRIRVPARGERVSVRIYSVTGALVRDLYEGAPSGDIALAWNGTDNHGNPVASATYYAQIRMGGERRTLKMVLLK